MPSISAILGGYVFMTASVYTTYMIPFIWLGNFAIVYLYKILLLNKKVNYFVAGIAAIVVKVGVIFLGFNILKIALVFPDKVVQNLQNAMGFMQALTAGIAMIITYTVYSANKKVISKVLTKQSD